MWDKNVVALGLSSGFLEPLESTSIHLAQLGASRLLSMMPKRGINPVIVEQYNNSMLFDYNNVKDFLIAHYKVTQREDTPFRRHCRHMEIPDSLKTRLEIYAEQGRAAVLPTELFKESSWFALLMGQGMAPRDYNPIADAISLDDLKQRMARLRTHIQERLKALPQHDAFIQQHCRAPEPEMAHG
jgi:tryptophan halogenase